MQSNTFSSADNLRDGGAKHRLPSGLSLAGATLLLVLGILDIAAADTDVCEVTAQAIFFSDRVGALTDYRLALAKALNITNAAARNAATRQARADLREERAASKERRAARLAACEKLGGGAYDPVINPANFIHGVTNPYFPLTPGTTFIYEGQTAQGFEHDEFAVTHNTRVILGVTCIEVHDTVTTDGQLTEDTLDWFAQDTEGNVWYFGENTHELENGLITTIDGTFMAGINGDKAGIIMKARPVIGDFYRQEFSLNNAEDFAETLSLNESVTVPGGSFNHCLKSKETTPLETDLLEYKFYAPNVGNVLTVDARTGDRVALVQIRSE